jgi:hypothetical protein
MAIKGAATTAAIGVGTMAVNEYLKRNGKAGIDASVLQTAINTGKTIFSYAGYMY